MDRPVIKGLDALVILAKNDLGGSRRRSPWRWVVFLLIIVLLLGLWIWWVWPVDQLPALTIAAFDVLARPDEPVGLCAQLGPLDEDASKAKLGRLAIYFQELQTNLEGRVETTENGRSCFEQAFPAAKLPIDYFVRYPGDGQSRRGLQTKGRVFVWPPDASILLVDADGTLATAGEESLWTLNNLDIRPRAGAVQALRAASAKYSIIYLSEGASTLARYNKLRAWLERGWAPANDRFPGGAAPGVSPAVRGRQLSRRHNQGLAESLRGQPTRHSRK